MYHRTVLPNGIRVVTEHIPYVRSVSLGVWFETGSRNENPTQRGFSHFLEHMVFKGSERFSARDIAELMDTCGGHLNAFTGKEYTCYYARVLDENLLLAADLLKEMLMNSLFDLCDIDKERGVVLEEINMLEDTPDELVHDMLCEVLWPNHSLGQSILGTRQSIMKAKREELLAYMKSFYTTDRLVITAAGHVDHHRVVELASAFDALPHHSPQVCVTPSLSCGQQVLKRKDTEQVHICLGGQGLARPDGRKYALYLLDTMIGGGMSSRLFQNLREERGLVYSTFSYHSSYRDTGYYAVYAACSPSHVEEVIRQIEEELVKLTADSLDQSELERAKGQLKGSLMLSLESTTHRMTRLAKSEMNVGRVTTPDETIAEIERITVADIKELARQLYASGSWSIASVGPLPETSLLLGNTVNS